VYNVNNLIAGLTMSGNEAIATAEKGGGRYGLTQVHTHVASLLHINDTKSPWALQDFPIKNTNDKKILRVAFPQEEGMWVFHDHIKPSVNQEKNGRQRVYSMYKHPFQAFSEAHHAEIRSQIKTMNLEELGWHIEFTTLPQPLPDEREDVYQQRLKKFAGEGPIIIPMQGGVPFKDILKETVEALIHDVPSFFAGYAKQPQAFFAKYETMLGPQGVTKPIIKDDKKTGPLAKIIIIPKDSLDLPHYKTRVFKHEFCHALGLKHPPEGPNNDTRLDNNATIMGKHIFRGHLPEIYDTLKRNFAELQRQYTANNSMTKDALVTKITDVIFSFYHHPDMMVENITMLDREALKFTAESFQSGKPLDVPKIFSSPPMIVSCRQSPIMDKFKEIIHSNPRKWLEELLCKGDKSHQERTLG
jgi:hypothetical protein